MNPTKKPETEAIRSDIDITRRRMDDTIDALGNRLQGRHLLDEVLGFFRRRDTSGKMDRVREKFSDSANTAAHTVIETVRSNPMPALLIGAGVAWMIYQNRREETGSGWSEQSGEPRPEMLYDPDTHYDRPLQYSTPGQMELETGGESKASHMKHTLAEKTSSAKYTMKEKASQLGDRTRDSLHHARDAAGEKMHELRDRAGELGTRVQERAHDAYVRTRERVVSTAEQHPLEVGLGCLAAGLLIGLSLRTPEAVNRVAGPTADRLRDRTRDAGRDMVEKGKRVAEAATTAVKDEAEAQGLTPEHLREKAGAVARSAREATDEEIHREGESGAPGNPPIARPAM